MTAEAMLLVDDCQGEVVEQHLVLEQRVCTDDKVDLAERQTVEDGLALAATVAAGEKGDVDAATLASGSNGREVLSCRISVGAMIAACLRPQ